jgi:hypothetical protein
MSQTGPTAGRSPRTTRPSFWLAVLAVLFVAAAGFIWAVEQLDAGVFP